MKLKKYEAPNVREALEQVKAEMGSEAVIIRTERTKGGFTVTAAVDEVPKASPADADAVLPARDLYGPDARRRADPTDSSRAGSESVLPAKPAVPPPVGALAPTAPPAPPLPATPPFAAAPLMQEMEAMRRELREMRSELASRHLESLRAVPDEFREVAGVLLDRGLALEQTVDVVAQVALECPPGERTSEGIRAAVRNYLAKRLPVANLLELKGRRPKIVLFLGPTGVGKSTTIAKVAARCLLDNKLQPAILSTDSYRMGAMEQMTAFAQAAGILFETVFRPEDADAAMGRLGEADLVLVDTAGRARGHQEHLVELRELVRRLMPDEIHLVVAAGMRERDLADTYDRFAPLGVDHLVFTKLDETLEPGALFALPVRKGVPISLICDGQAIPDDLHIANADALAALILGVPA